jgi:Carboxypeptidase regulatory-like domain
MNRRNFVIFALLCLAATGLFAQSVNVNTGSVDGRVTDSTGGALPGVTVTATNVDTGLTRNTVSENDGTYNLNLLQPGTYRLVVELAGLGKTTVPKVIVSLGNTTKENIKLSPQVSETLTVTATAPMVDTTRSGTTASVNNDKIENLPIIGRDFKALALLTPGITGSAFDGTLTANGARGLSTDFNIDGANANNDFFGSQTGGTRSPFTFSQAAIKEFQVIRSQYDAEYGRGVGATVNAITKSGTNQLDGEAFYFLRKKNWASKRPLILPGFVNPTTGVTTTQAVSESFLAVDSSQPGVAVGGPIVHDKLFYFFDFDGQRQSLPVLIGFNMRDTSFTGPGTYSALNATDKATVDARINAITGKDYLTGLIYSQTFNQNTYLAKLDANVGDKNHFSLRDNYLKFTNANSQGLTVLGLNQTTEIDKYNQLVAEGESVISNNLLNQFVVQSGRDQRPVSPNSPGTEASLTFATNSGTRTQFFGLNDVSNSTADEKKVQLKDTVQYIWGAHTVKAGAELLHRDLFDSFPRYVSGLATFANLAQFVNNTPGSFRQAAGPLPGNPEGNVAWKTNLYSGYANDSVRVGSKLTLDIGLRYDLEDTPVPSVNHFPQHPEFITQIKNDTNNYAPRLGFAYDIGGNGKSVLRGGTGKFFSYMPDILLASPIQSISGALVTATFSCNFASPTTNLCPTYPNLLPAQLPTDQFFRQAAASSDIVTIGSNYQAQEAWRTSLQFEQQLGKDLTGAVGGVFSHLTHVQGSRNINTVYSGINFANLPVYTVTSAGVAGRLYPDMGVIREIYSGEQAWYRAVTAELHKFSGDSKFSWDLSYTFANSYDYETNTRSTSTSFLWDPKNPALSEGYSDNDIRHRVVGDLTYHLPWGLLLSAVGTWHTGVPYTEGIAFNSCTGCLSSSLSGQSSTTGNVSVFVDHSGNVIDLNAVNAANGGTGMSRQQFSDFLAGQGATLLGRNTLRQPDVWDADMRLSKYFQLPRGMQLELLGEVFNITNNKIQFVTSANQIAYTENFNLTTDRITFIKNSTTGKAQNPNFSLPGGYNAEVNPRQFQVAAKIIF